MQNVKTLFLASALALAPLAVSAETGRAIIKGTGPDSNIEGEVTLTDTQSGLLIQGSLKSAPPGLHGFHIHEFGSCDDKGNAAGSHYNPTGAPHGHLVTDGLTKAHAGDLGNIKIAEDGTGSWLYTLPDLKLSGATYTAAGRAFIMHENADDFGQPTGNAGGRIACGAILTIKPQTALDSSS